MNTYTVGQLVHVSSAFKNVEGTLLDPTTVALRVRKPSGTTLTPGVTRDSAGQYHADVEVDVPGGWTYYWYSTGSGETAGNGEFYVVPAAA